MNKSRGFTLIELIVSMGVGSLLLMAAALLAKGFGNDFRRHHAGIGCEREGRACMGIFRSDIASGIYHDDISFPVAEDEQEEILGFLCLKPAEAQTAAGHTGDLCAVLYYLEYRQIEGKPVRCLIRGFRESKEVTIALLEGRMAGLLRTKRNDDEPVGFGIRDFQIQALARNRTGVLVAWNPGDPGRPEVFEFGIHVAQSEFLARVRTEEDWERKDGKSEYFVARGRFGYEK